ncbi:anti-sigma factor antagonist [Streptomyces sp. Act143]|uniref:STAS domain-containing protein n=1 Tax=Streptomyces sp. Act143 TaxID=2200760 RepID=UPI000D67E615|nr:STAS domain-containing protein [Streptomyces sp. Act143]PWI13302.1 anti-sigma factor antagonist [Streptomyces sp. Act143]
MFKDHEVSAPSHTERVVDDTTVVELCGEIDLCTGPPLSARLDSLTAVPFPDLVLDLRQVAFIDCSGLRTLCRARNRVLARGGRLRLVIESARLLSILRCVDLGEAFEVVPGPPDGARPASRADRVAATAC